MQLLVPTHQRIQMHQAEHHHTAEMVERNHALYLPHDTNANTKQSKEQAAGTPNRQHVTHQLFTTHTSAPFAAAKHATRDRSIINQSASSGLEQANIQQVPTGESPVSTQGAARRPR